MSKTEYRFSREQRAIIEANRGRDPGWGGRPMYFDREGVPLTLMEWAIMFEDFPYRQIARTEFSDPARRSSSSR